MYRPWYLPETDCNGASYQIANTLTIWLRCFQSTSRLNDIMTSLFLCWRCTTEKIVYIFLQNLSKHRIDCVHYLPASCRFFIWKTDEISRTMRLMDDGISFDKILRKQLVVLCYMCTHKILGLHHLQTDLSYQYTQCSPQPFAKAGWVDVPFLAHLRGGEPIQSRGVR
jgi:hypothetical protein